MLWKTRYLLCCIAGSLSSQFAPQNAMCVEHPSPSYRAGGRAEVWYGVESCFRSSGPEVPCSSVFMLIGGTHRKSPKNIQDGSLGPLAQWQTHTGSHQGVLEVGCRGISHAVLISVSAASYLKLSKRIDSAYE